MWYSYRYVVQLELCGKVILCGTLSYVVQLELLLFGTVIVIWYSYRYVVKLLL